MTWIVNINKKVLKKIPGLPKGVRQSLFLLACEIEKTGPVRGNWANYGKLENNRYHCHLKKGRPTYVAVWEVKNKKIQLVEVIYAGTHEKAPY